MTPAPAQTPPRTPVLDWLLESDPALRWQVERDLLGAPEAVWSATRARVATEGAGAAVLAQQDPDGQWDGGAYFPDPPRPEDDGPGQPWTATTWALNDLREWGVDAAALGDTAERLAANSRWEYDELPYWQGEVDVCINAWTLQNGTWLGVDMSALARWFVEHRLEDGGWNCEWVEGSTRSSVESTLSAVRALLDYELITGDLSVRAARHAGEEYLLARRLLRRLSTGELIGPWTTQFAYPFRWRYSALRAVDHFRAAAVAEGLAPDPRLAEAVGVIRAARQPDGRWRQEARHPGRAWVEVDAPVGEPSRWLTFHGIRVLDWWDAAHR